MTTSRFSTQEGAMHLNVSIDLNYISRTVTVTEHSGAEAPAELYLKVKALRPCTQQTVHQYVSQSFQSKRRLKLSLWEFKIFYKALRC